VAIKQICADELFAPVLFKTVDCLVIHFQDDAALIADRYRSRK